MVGKIKIYTPLTKYMCDKTAVHPSFSFQAYDLINQL